MPRVTPSSSARRSISTALLWGEDEFLLRLAALQLAEEHAVKPTEIEGADWRGMETADLATPSLWGERRGLLVTNCQGLPEAGARELKSYLEAPVPEAICVLTWVTRGRNAPPLGKVVQAGGGLVRQVALRRQDLPKWILERARHRGTSVSSAAAVALVDTVGEDPA